MKTLAWMFIILLLTGCDVPETQPDTGEVVRLYGKVYDAVATRVDSKSPWYVVSGKSALALEQGDSDKNGMGLMSFFNYYEPQFCAINQSCICTGNLRFSFVISDSTITQSPDAEADKNYNVFDPYVDPTAGPVVDDTTPTTEEIFQVFLYEMSLKPETVQMSEFCRPQAARSIRILRYQSGEIILQDSYREILLRPRSNN